MEEILTAIHMLVADMLNVAEERISVRADMRVSDETGEPALFVDVRLDDEPLTGEAETVLRQLLDVAAGAAKEIQDARALLPLAPTTTLH